MFVVVVGGDAVVEVVSGVAADADVVGVFDVDAAVTRAMVVVVT